MRPAIRLDWLICVPGFLNLYDMKRVDFSGKRVLIRVDFNVPLDSDKQITDDTRMRKAIPTIRTVLDRGGSIILMSHLGRPQQKRAKDGSIDRNRFSLLPLVEPLAEMTGAKVLFARDCGGPSSKKLAASLQSGQILLLENTRFLEGEEQGDADFAHDLAKLGDFYINDAFGTAHRAHASTTLVANFFEPQDKMFGILMEAELANAEKILHRAKKPLVAILGGAKVSDKIGLLSKLLLLADSVIIGGAMAFTFIKSKGGRVGNSLVEEDKLDLARDILDSARQQNVSLHLPTDAVIADKYSADARIDVVPIDEIPEGWMGLDIGPESIQIFSESIKSAETILWNGPMGVFEMAPFEAGTLAIAESVAAKTRAGAYSLVGGGDSVAAVNQSGSAADISFISTGGGAMLEYLEGKELPGVAAIRGNTLTD
jgi:phosphoglycerate kinase